MKQYEHQLVARVFPSENHTLKLFAINSPTRLNELGLLNLYSENSFREDDFCYDLLSVLRTLPPSCESIELENMLEECRNFYSSALFDQSWEDLVKEFHLFLKRIRWELETFHLYQNGVLNFNALWLDGNDSLIFFRMEKNDAIIKPA